MHFGRLLSKRTFIAVSVSLGVNLLLARFLASPTAQPKPPQSTTRFTLQTVAPPPEPEKPPQKETPRETNRHLPTHALPMEAVLLPSTDAKWAAMPSMLTNQELFASKGGVPAYVGDGSGAGAAGHGAQAPELLFYPDLSQFYPLEARRKRLSGRTVVGLGLDASGAVTHVEIVASSPPGVFNQAAQRAAMRVRYRPAQEAGKARPSHVRLEFLWELDA